MQNSIDLNSQFQRALDLMENSSQNIFVTGKAGTGKSTLLKYFREQTKKKVVVLAPTGVAALNVQGETIHSFFKFKPDITPQKIDDLKRRASKIYKELDAIIIDEISMVRADLLDCVDLFLQRFGKNPRQSFGGTQLIFFGDLYQLPPVVTPKDGDIFRTYYSGPYFFNAHCYTELKLEMLELEKVYRQKDSSFIDILNAIRTNNINDKDLATLNSRVGKTPPKTQGYTLHLTPTNAQAHEINSTHLMVLDSKVFTYTAQISGEFKESYYPTESVLELAKGAQIMMLNNDSKDRWVNGSLGEILEIKESKTLEDPDKIILQLENGTIEEITPYTWEIFNYILNEKTGALMSEVAGTFTQYPLRLAWSLTIHKSQGKTFEQTVIDMGQGGAFAHGQTYVALSRCTSLNGIFLKRPIQKRDVLVDWKIVSFMRNCRSEIAEKFLPMEEKMEILRVAIEQKKNIEVLYLNGRDQKNKRLLLPRTMGKMSFNGAIFNGLSAYCYQSAKERTYRLDRILEINANPAPESVRFYQR